MSESNVSTDVYLQYKRRNTVAKDDAAVASELSKLHAKWINSDTFLATGQRDPIYSVPGIFDRLMCLKLGADLSQVLGMPVIVTSRYEDADLGSC